MYKKETDLVPTQEHQYIVWALARSQLQLEFLDDELDHIAHLDHGVSVQLDPASPSEKKKGGGEKESIVRGKGHWAEAGTHQPASKPNKKEWGNAVHERIHLGECRVILGHGELDARLLAFPALSELRRASTHMHPCTKHKCA